MRLKPHEFLAELTRNVRQDSAGSLWISCKRHCVKHPLKKLDGTAIAKVVQEHENVALIRAQSSTLHVSTEVSSGEMKAFTQAIGNIIRLTSSTPKPGLPNVKQRKLARRMARRGIRGADKMEDGPTTAAPQEKHVAKPKEAESAAAVEAKPPESEQALAQN
eukprot:Gregarina_sp_Pseudo_9__1384@NODE_1928_length_1247_cov_50_201987_g1788_i0_p2_GENE_NODE_1928_length_1247_cov_50_201987_g1788_i0NODE_1928_length_1247_cov_50_201987_g1788_i0_p2_ORF_typecomplete_len162_score5_46SRP14/PF02290_15/8_3e10_NODE_1928_length_1247_cov_50_201987_g1788_i0126611